MPSRVPPFLALSLAIVLAACMPAPAGPVLTDPTEILTRGVEATTKARTAHFTAILSGRFAGGLPGLAPGAEINLAGTTLEGDVDIEGKRLHAAFSVPALFGLSGEIVQVGQVSYIRTSVGGPLFQKQVAAGLPVDELTDTALALEALRTALALPGVSPTKVDDTRCGDGRDCYQVRMELSADQVAPALNIGASLSVTVGVEKDSFRISRVVVSAAVGDEGSADMTLDLTKWDEALVINEPPADQVDDNTGG